METKNWFKLSHKNISRLIVYYSLLVVVGFLLVFFAISNEDQLYIDLQKITVITLIGSSGFALLGSSLSYLRKIYKCCINVKMDSPNGADDQIRQTGVLIYYYLRPFFALAFSLIIHVFLKEGVNIITIEQNKLSYNFIYLNFLLSFFTGLSTGDILDYLNEKGKKIVTERLNR